MMVEPNTSISEFIGDVERACQQFKQPFGLRELLFCIRDIPYGRPTSPRDPASVLADWKGTCSGKHLLARAILASMGLRSKLFCLPYRLDDAVEGLPREVVQPYVGRGLWDVHNYLELETVTGAVTVDVTWSRDLADFGFPTTLAWDGAQNFRIAAPIGVPIQVANDADLNTVKDQLLQSLNSAPARTLREQYIEDLSAFASKHSTRSDRVNGVLGTLKDIRQRNTGYRS